MEDNDFSPSLHGRPEIMIEFRQDGNFLGLVSIKEFQNSGEARMGYLINDQVKFWNEMEQNQNDHVTAHVVLKMV